MRTVIIGRAKAKDSTDATSSLEGAYDEGTPINPGAAARSVDSGRQHGRYRVCCARLILWTRRAATASISQASARRFVSMIRFRRTPASTEANSTISASSRSPAVRSRPASAIAAWPRPHWSRGQSWLFARARRRQHNAGPHLGPAHARTRNAICASPSQLPRVRSRARRHSSRPSTADAM